jgi:hypothetical protein
MTISKLLINECRDEGFQSGIRLSPYANGTVGAIAPDAMPVGYPGNVGGTTSAGSDTIQWSAEGANESVNM